jgi:hypothetical protein
MKKKINRKLPKQMTQSQANKFLTYYSHCQFLYDFIEEDWERSSGNVRKVKLLTNQLKNELEKNVDHIFKSQNSEGVDMQNVVEQFVNASGIMKFFFELGLQMDTMEEDKKLELNNRVNSLMEEYGLDLKMYGNER